MHTAYQPVVEVLGDTLALMTRRERGVWSLHDTNTDILAIAKEDSRHCRISIIHCPRSGLVSLV